MIIAIDFDGTLHWGQYPNIGIIAQGAVENIMKLRRDGHYIIIWTCRTGDLLTEAINWLCEWGIPYNRINDNHPSNKVEFGGNTRKIYADVYIDDKQIGELPSWDEIYEYVRQINLNK